ncbi:MAG: hypothetical protein U0232_06355 [Thermomicrobiales bacterium]
MAQFAPAILGGIFWKEARGSGARRACRRLRRLGLHPALPSFAQSGWPTQTFLNQDRGASPCSSRSNFLGLRGTDAFTHALFWTMLANVGGYVGVSILSRQNAVEQRQATLFVDVFRGTAAADGVRTWRGAASLAELRQLLARFVGPERADETLREYALARGLDSATAPARADAELIH